MGNPNEGESRFVTSRRNLLIGTLFGGSAFIAGAFDAEKSNNQIHSIPESSSTNATEQSITDLKKRRFIANIIATTGAIIAIPCAGILFRSKQNTQE